MTATGADTGVLLVFADLVLDPYAYQVTRGAREVGLTLAEFRMLGLLMDCPGQVVSRERLYAAAWGAGRVASSQAVDRAVGRLRRKLEAGGEPRLVGTVRGVGFVLRETQGGAT